MDTCIPHCKLIARVGYQNHPALAEDITCYPTLIADISFVMWRTASNCFDLTAVTKRPMENDDAKSVTRLHSTLGETTVRVLDWLSLVIWGLVALVGLLQAQRINGGWLTSYGGDVFGPIAFWWALRRTIFASPKFGAEIAALTQLIGCFAWEFCQRADLSNTFLFFTEGTFDPFDLVAYSATLIGCYSLDRLLQYRQRCRGNSTSKSIAKR